jgi:hypothetical protein
MSVGCSPHNGGARSLEDKLSGRLARRLCVDLCPRLPDARPKPISLAIGLLS